MDKTIIALVLVICIYPVQARQLFGYLSVPESDGNSSRFYSTVNKILLEIFTANIIYLASI
jgi:hypothetical protein